MGSSDAGGVECKDSSIASDMESGVEPGDEPWYWYGVNNMRLWVVRYEHKHGEDIAVATSEEVARNICAAWMMEYKSDLYDRDLEEQLLMFLQADDMGQAMRLWADNMNEYFSVDEVGVVEGPSGPEIKSEIRKALLQLKQQDLEDVALEDNQAAVGKTILVSVVSCFIGSDSTELHFDPPKRFRVVETESRDVLHWNDQWLDPYWNVEPIDDVQKDARSFWVYGPSYCTNGDTAPSTEWSFE